MQEFKTIFKKWLTFDWRTYIWRHTYVLLLSLVSWFRFRFCCEVVSVICYNCFVWFVSCYLLHLFVSRCKMADPQPGTSRSSSLVSFPSPKKKRSKTGPLRSWEKQTLINVFKYVEESWPQDNSILIKRISWLKQQKWWVPMSVPTVYSVLKEYRTTHRLQSPPPAATKPNQADSLDDMDMAAIRRHVHQMFFNNEMPTKVKI